MTSCSAGSEKASKLMAEKATNIAISVDLWIISLKKKWAAKALIKGKRQQITLQIVNGMYWYPSPIENCLIAPDNPRSKMRPLHPVGKLALIYTFWIFRNMKTSTVQRDCLQNDHSKEVCPYPFMRTLPRTPIRQYMMQLAFCNKRIFKIGV